MLQIIHRSNEKFAPKVQKLVEKDIESKQPEVDLSPGVTSQYVQHACGDMDFLALLLEYLEVTRIEKKLRERTIGYHTKTIQDFSEFLLEHNLAGLKLGEIRVKHLEAFRAWYMKKTGTGNISLPSKKAEFCRAAVRYAVRVDYLQYDTLGAFENRRDRPKEVVHLEKDELEVLTNAEFNEWPKLRVIRDLYVLQSWTGLSYADIYTFKIVQRGNREWIIGKRNKNGRSYYIPLFDEAKRILEKYNYQLPIRSNQSYNRDLKFMALSVGIKKHLTTHTARKTFASLCKEKGWSGTSIADMLGNTIAVCETYYLSKSISRVEAELERMSKNTPES